MPSKSQKPRVQRVSWTERIKSLFRRREGSPPPVVDQIVGKAGSRKGKRQSHSKGAASAAHMLKALRAVLDRHEAARSVLAHLHVVEQALEHRGVAALEDVPADVLARALSQLEMLVSDWTEPGIAALRAQVKAAMAKPGRFDAPRRGAQAKKSTDFDNSRLQVNEASVSTFMEAHARWETSLTGGR
jgi:hypothetical protein